MLDVKTHPKPTRGGIVEKTKYLIKDGMIVIRTVTRQYGKVQQKKGANRAAEKVAKR